MGRLRDLTGQRFGRLLVLERAPVKNKKTMWFCRCDCGSEALVNGSNLLRGKQQSCGCLRRELPKLNPRKWSPEYRRAYRRKVHAQSPALRERELEKMRARAADGRRSIKRQVIAAYGGRCACCSEYRIEFLAIDHINRDGSAHRKAIGAQSGLSTYRWLIRNGFPPGFRVLCHNCNVASWNYGRCPHEGAADYARAAIAEPHQESVAELAEAYRLMGRKSLI